MFKRLLESLAQLLKLVPRHGRLDPVELLIRADAVRERLRMMPWTLDELRKAADADHE